ncbi:MAG: hypothetical protein QOC65_557 [Sphingomonadales bacterium]|nr:hypothetical protein [Sphingomonadales bacterium]
MSQATSPATTPSQNESSTRRRGYRPWIILFGTFIGVGHVMTSGCTDPADLAREHERLCHREARVTVVDEALWRQYRDGARARHHARLPEPSARDTKVGLEYVPRFEERFGQALTTTREAPVGSIVRNDISILYGDRLVVRIVDLISVYQVMGSQQSLSCVGRFPELYFEEDEAR